MNSDLLKRLIEAGTPADLVAEVAMLAAEAATAIATLGERRRKDRVRKAIPRNSTDSAEIQDEVSPQKKVSPTPPSKKTPPFRREANASLFSSTDIENAFERFRAAYPKRQGSNPRKPAFDKFAAAIKAGTDPEAVIAGARAYAQEQAQLGKAGSEFVKQWVVWLNQRCWEDYAKSRSTSDVDENGNWLGPRHLRASNGQPQEHPEPGNAAVLRGRPELHQNGEGDGRGRPMPRSSSRHRGMVSLGDIFAEADWGLPVGDEGGDRGPPH